MLEIKRTKANETFKNYLAPLTTSVIAISGQTVTQDIELLKKLTGNITGSVTRV